MSAGVCISGTRVPPETAISKMMFAGKPDCE
jgi:hypothetical protein